MSSKARLLVPTLLVFGVGLALYWRTLLPDVGTWDTAEFQAIGPVLGIAHPTGFPTYTLVAWLASVLLQPFGNEAYRADLLSALLVAGAGALTVVATIRLTSRPWLGLLAGILLVLTPIAWGVGTRADAHALHGFFAALLLVLLIEWRRGLDGRWLVAAALVYGLSLGNHALTLLLAPGIAVFVLLVHPRILWRQPRLVLTCIAVLAGAAMLVYAYIPLRSATGPPLDYAEPRTWGQFWYLVLGEQFQGTIRPLPSAGETVARIWDELVRNLGPLVMLVPAGLVLGAMRHWRTVVLMFIWFASTWLFALGYPNARIERYYLVPLLLASIWIALAIDVAWDAVRDALRRPTKTSDLAADGGGRSLGWWLSRDRFVGALLALVIVVVVAAPMPDRFASADRSGDTSGRTWLEAMFEALEPGAAVVSWWSYSTPLWYGRWVEGRRSDIIIVDDRDVIDDGFGTAMGAVDHFLGDRPVYIVRLSRDIPRFEERYDLERIESVPGPGRLYRVLGPRQESTAEPA